MPEIKHDNSRTLRPQQTPNMGKQYSMQPSLCTTKRKSDYDKLFDHLLPLYEVRQKKPRNKPLASILLVTYNQRRFISDAIESVLSQCTDFDFELVIGDDCSTDGTREVAESAQRAHPERIKLLIGKDNSGQHTGNGRINFFRTLGECDGKFIALLEGDDYWCHKQKLQKQVDFLRNNEDFSGSCHQTRVIDSSGPTGKIYGNFRESVLTAADTIQPYSPWHTSSFVFRRASLELHPWCKTVRSLDMAIFTLCALKGKIHAIPEIMSVYRKHEGGITHSGVFHGKTEDYWRIDLWQNVLNTFGDAVKINIERTLAHHHAKELRNSTANVAVNKLFFHATRIARLASVPRLQRMELILRNILRPIVKHPRRSSIFKPRPKQTIATDRPTNQSTEAITDHQPLGLETSKK